MDEEVIPGLYVEDASRAVAWYRHLGFEKELEHQFESGFPWFVSVARGGVRLYLSEHTGDARPNTLIHIYLNDIDAVSPASSTCLSMKTAQPGASVISQTPRQQTACSDSTRLTPAR